MIHLVRHAHAGVRAHWTGPDDRRPLTDRGRLQAKRIAALLTFLRKEWGNDAEAIPPESVAATRAATRERRQPWSAVELLAIEKPDFVPAPAKQEDK